MQNLCPDFDQEEVKIHPNFEYMVNNDRGLEKINNFSFWGYVEDYFRIFEYLRNEKNII